MRNPFGYQGEGSTREPGPNETKEEKEIYDRAFTTRERYNMHSELFSKLSSMRYRYMARFGKDTVAPFNEVYEVVKEILISANFLAELQITQRDRALTEDEQKEMKQYRCEFR